MRKNIGITIDPQLWREFRAYCNSRDQKFSHVLEMALSSYITARGKPVAPPGEGPRAQKTLLGEVTSWKDIFDAPPKSNTDN